MVIVECPLCKEDVDLGHYELWQEGPEIFECPYCHEDFEWTSWDELERLKKALFLFLFLPCLIKI